MAKTPYMFPFELDRKTESSGTYPIVLVSYLIACTEYDSADEAAIVKGYLEYVISPEGQEIAASNAGSAPLSSGLTKKIEPAVEAIRLAGGSPTVEAHADTTTNAGQILGCRVWWSAAPRGPGLLQPRDRGRR